MRVGTSLHFASSCNNGQDHPHACGDKGIRHIRGLQKMGSSPCVWGQAPEPTISSGQERIIPMRVGTRSSRHTALRL
mgnify:CR=1 FL=1